MTLRADLLRAGQRARSRYNPSMYRIAVIALVVVFVGLQYRLWVADGGWSEVHRLSQQRAELEARNARASNRNAALQAEIDDLKSGEQATEGRARSDIGMIRKDESFFLTVAPPGRNETSAEKDRQAAR
ncbi:cell division protein FtsB [Salinisphaera orenii MK-B5]|uniref:Cell division protein FtsB n=1 Tax=Salinisphaera orenii MK-B5 TaxID=856730 RepID=A0A423PXH9_9GAMM|nr:septum formation initiator family protein [Salinisphaera orenii]ROO30323.1 cell division protein FtsB [Salinisphaera orenii MK-B5]